MHIRAERSEQEAGTAAFVSEPSILLLPGTACEDRDAESGRATWPALPELLL